MSKKPLHILFAQMPFCRFSAETFGKLTLLTSHSTRVLLLLRRSGENEVSFYAFFLSFFSHEILPRRSCLSGPHRRMDRPLVEIRRDLAHHSSPRHRYSKNMLHIQGRITACRIPGSASSGAFAGLSLALCPYLPIICSEYHLHKPGILLKGCL